MQLMVYLYYWVLFFKGISLGHFDSFHICFRFDHGSRIYTLLGLSVRLVIPKPDHAYICFTVRTYIYVSSPVYENFNIGT